jgi:hypothetical protein
MPSYLQLFAESLARLDSILKKAYSIPRRIGSLRFLAFGPAKPSKPFPSSAETICPWHCALALSPPAEKLFPVSHRFSRQRTDKT